MEPGFYYISYAMSIGTVWILGALIFMLGNGPVTWVYRVTISSVLVLTVPLMFRYARVLLLYFISGVEYQPEIEK